ncbi:putative endo-1,3(4)-beta-glucanase ARB [Sesamum angolense]|uniref:glucan endo-1,3-beta-D-glucosidase n=1 Tax=Sesamum angolense TaxID=2727404 RepID=A0AAE2BPX9_9LAMI|nr:putative endo-1,3(4)-beta-glucanase ARB [Sesamum angolense]
MLKKIRRRVKTSITKPFKKKTPPRKPPQAHSSSPSRPPSPAVSPSTPPPQTAEMHRSRPFLFPQAQSTVLPDPSPFFAPQLLSTPLPTNSFFQNFVLKSGDQPEYFHPYLVKSSQSALTLCFPSLFKNPAFIYQIFISDLIISTLDNPNPNANHVISSFTDLSVTLDFPSSSLRFFLVRGSPFLTCNVMRNVALSISTIHAILELSPNSSCTKYTIKLNNNQTWLLYASSPISLSHDINTITSSVFSGVVRIAALPDAGPKFEAVLDRFSSCYPVSVMLFSPSLSLWISVLEDFKGIEEDSYSEIIKALIKDVEALDASAISTSSSYFYAKLIARAARLALIAEEVGYFDVIPAIRKFLKDTIQPWLEGTFGANGFLYDGKWGGIVTKQGAVDSGADFGFGVYNDHHYHLGYFVYGIAVLAKIDAAWGRKYRPQAYALMADYMNLSRRANSNYACLRNFDFWKLHSWAGGLTEFADGRNQESTSEAVNAYYSAALMGLAYGDSHLVSIGSTISAFEIQAAKTWWHVKEEDNLYPEEFTRENRVVGVLWAGKRDSGLWFAPADWRECRLGIQLLPILPISETLFSDVQFVRQLVRWTLPALAREGVGEGWKGFLYALQGIYDKEEALVNIRNLNGYDDGNSLTNLLWWIHSRDDREERCDGGGTFCWYRHYSH